LLRHQRLSAGLLARRAQARLQGAPQVVQRLWTGRQVAHQRSTAGQLLQRTLHLLLLR
jgi:hypothetical protein